MLFGLPGYALARLIWLLISIVLVAASARWLWRIYQGPTRHAWAAWLIAFSLAPALSALSKGQITPLVLFGQVGFLLTIHHRRNDWLAGACAALVAIKPQLVYLFWPALVLWIIVERRWKVLGGLLFTGLAALAIGMAFNPRLIQQYLEMLASYPPTAWFTPTPGAYLRLAFGVEQFWLQYLPMALGLGWLILYWLRQRASWSWPAALPALTLASIVTTPYGWTYDQVVLLAALLPAWISLLKFGTRAQITGMALGYILINLTTVILHRRLSEEYFGWLAPLWLAWYWIAEWYCKPRRRIYVKRPT